MPIRKSTDIENESDSRYDRVKDTKSREKITKRFDSATHNPYPGDEALQYLAKKLDDVIDSANINDAKTGITSGQSSAITANTAKVTQHPITANHTLAITIENDRSSGAPTHISFTVTNNTDGVRDSDRTKTIRLELS